MLPFRRRLGFDFGCIMACCFMVGCAEPKHVDFVFFNLSGMQIRVVNIDGLPPGVAAGYLVPVHDENNRLQESSTSFFDPILVADRLKIVWQEAGVLRELELTREELGLPSKLEDSKVRFTYQGNGKWRVSRLK